MITRDYPAGKYKITSLSILANLCQYGFYASYTLAQLIYETSQRPEESQRIPWVNRLETQLKGAADLMESAVVESIATGHTWLLGNQLTQADISTAVAWRFMMHIDRVDLDTADYPALVQFSARAEALPEFVACPLS